MKVLHQAGHNTTWNCDSLDDGHGDGLIISPVHLDLRRVEALPEDLKSKSLFDPQFYVPESQKTKLNTYGFFPDRISSGFKTIDFQAIAFEAAKQCVEFQIQNNFESLIIPARFHSELISDYIERQRLFSVEPFLAALESKKSQKKVFVSLPLTSAMTIDLKFRNAILNWITSYTEISGVYLLVDMQETKKQIRSKEKLSALIQIISSLKEADLDVIYGYGNVESLIVSVADPYAVTVGTYENTRMFSIDKFLESDSEKRGPSPRLYFPKLLNWIRFDTASEIKDDFPEIWEKIYSPTTCSDELFQLGQTPHFTKPQLYKHAIQLLNKELQFLAKMPPQDRKTTMMNRIDSALKLYQEIDNVGIKFFDDNCGSEHLPNWSRVLRNS